MQLNYWVGVHKILPRRWLETIDDVAECRRHWHSDIQNIFLLYSSSANHFPNDLHHPSFFLLFEPMSDNILLIFYTIPPTDRRPHAVIQSSQSYRSIIARSRTTAFLFMLSLSTLRKVLISDLITLHFLYSLVVNLVLKNERLKSHWFWYNSQVGALRTNGGRKLSRIHNFNQSWKTSAHTLGWSD